MVSLLLHFLGADSFAKPVPKPRLGVVPKPWLTESRVTDPSTPSIRPSVQLEIAVSPAFGLPWKCSWRETDRQKSGNWTER